MDAVRNLAAIIPRPVEDVISDLKSFELLLKKWQPAQNLVSRETLNQVWTRHFADSLQVLYWLPESATKVIDLGSGGGFPVLPLAIASKHSDRSFTLVEPNTRKASFLRAVVRELKLNCVVEAKRADEIDSRETFDIVTSRALAPLPLLCGMMLPFFSTHTTALLHKGREHREEVRLAATHWQFDMLEHASITDPHAVILEIRNLASIAKR